MPDAPSIPFLTLSAMLEDLQYKWHSKEYYIAPDEVISEPRFVTPFRPKFYSIILCIQGWLDLMVNGQPIRLSEYTFFAGGPSIVAQRIGQSKDCKNKAIFFTKQFLVSNFESFHQFESFHFFSTHITNVIQLSKADATPLIRLYDILQEKRSNTHSAYHTEIIRNLIFAYVYETAIVYQKADITLPKRLTKSTNIGLQFQNLVAQNCMKQHQLQFYADALFVTPKYLIQAIKKATGQTPGEIIDEAIIIVAKIQLKNTSLNVDVIADNLHFADQASFSKFFKKHVGEPPLSFRKKTS